jgi:hypothetical protein
MADIKFVSGTVSNVSMISSTVSLHKGTGSAKTCHAFTFRIDSKPVKFNGVLNLSEGDEVKVAGFDKRGELQATVVKNLTTGVDYSNKPAYGCTGILVISFGIVLYLFIITIPFSLFILIIGIRCTELFKIMKIILRY